MFMLVLSIGYASAQGKADIKFDKTLITSVRFLKTIRL